MSLTTRPGSPDPSVDETESVAAEEENRSVPIRLLLLGAVAVVLAIIIGSQVLGVLYVLVFPPAPPLPAGVSMVSHTSTDHGMDEWLYTTSRPACEIVTFYIDHGGVCRIAPTCDDLDDDPVVQNQPTVENVSQNVARCVGGSEVSIFTIHWQVVVAASRDPDVSTEFRLIREVIWTGSPTPPEAPAEP